MFFTHRFFKKEFYRSGFMLMLLIALVTSIISEVKVIPFDEESFRFGLGSITFFLLILIWSPASLIRTGFVTGLTVVCLRIFGDVVLNDIQVTLSLKNHLPAFLFYFLFALGLHIIKVNRYKTFPLLLGAWATLFEFLGNGMEQLTRQLLLHHTLLSLKEWALLLGVALFRSYFVVGLYSSFTISEQKKRLEETLGVGSELYAETLYLQKLMNHIEQVTASSHDLYRQLKKKELHELSIQALHIAQEIHEVKKDSQRILSGLSKITVSKVDNPLFLSDVLNFVVSANEKYSELLKKNVTFHLMATIDYETDQQIPLLALLNNLTANAVEAISHKGEIMIEIFEESTRTCFVIKDTGAGILEEDVSVIFEPGYTTKFNDQGVAATGIGLSHVKEIIHTLKGKIQIETPKIGTVFRIEIPTENIRKRVE
ncbi:ATP-binding protein [Psychrobacillus vulpis]|uniref:histidine kinase n=1 Tax=Psychrobacillus vulpis TaxID=2325572 RepID=A0A544TRJ5_9BACI|nr:ATP-binding protein [Psychrobacillus vulpis]TQR20062.1 ATP-binding protein [Psychrobacillus vulpis]